MADTFDAPLIVADDKGNKFINREKLGENFFVLAADDSPLTVAASQKALTGFSIPEDAGHAGDFEGAGIVAQAVAPFLVQMSEVGIEASSFMNNPVHHNLFAGAHGLPFVLPETVFWIAGRFVQLEVTNLSSSLENSVKLAMVGRKFNSEMDPATRERRAAFLSSRPTRPFWLTLDKTRASLTANQTAAEYFLTMPSGSHFVAETIMAESTGPFSFAMWDGQSGRQLTYGAGSGNGFIDSRMLTGPGGLPAKTFGSPIIQPRRSIRVQLTDLSGAANVIYFTLCGRRMRMPVG